VKKPILNYFIDLGMAVAFILSAVTGILKYQEIPRFLVRFGIYLPTYGITLIHKWAGLALAVSAFTHLLLHWKWLLRMTGNLFRNRN
jgi:hypothetical protein